MFPNKTVPTPIKQLIYQHNNHNEWNWLPLSFIFSQGIRWEGSSDASSLQFSNIQTQICLARFTKFTWCQQVTLVTLPEFQTLSTCHLFTHQTSYYIEAAITQALDQPWAEKGLLTCCESFDARLPLSLSTTCVLLSQNRFTRSSLSLFLSVQCLVRRLRGWYW